MTLARDSLLRLLNLVLGASTGQLYQQLSLEDLRDTAADLRVEVRLIQFDDADRTVFPREISIDKNDKSESLRIELTVGADPDDAEAVAVRRWYPRVRGHERAQRHPASVTTVVTLRKQ